MARELIATYQTMTICGSWNINEFFLNYAFICLVIFFITGVKIGKQRFSIRKQRCWSSRIGKGIEVWMKSFGGTRCHESTETKSRNKNRESKEVERNISFELPHWPQEFKENLVDGSTSEGRRGEMMKRSAHFQFVLWAFNGAASIRGTGFW